MQTLKILAAFAIVVLFIGALGIYSWYRSHGFHEGGPVPGDSLLDQPQSEGEALARRYCVTCHLFPEPELVPRKSWRFLLTYMGMYLGIDKLDYLHGATDFEMEVIQNRLFIMKNLQLMPPEPVLDAEQWELLRKYYMEQAPVVSLPQAEKPPMIEDNSWFSARNGEYSAKSAIGTMVAIDEKHQEVLLFDMYASQLVRMGRNLEIRDKLDLPRDIVIVGSRFTESGADLLSIGDLGGSEPGKYMGAVFRLNRPQGYYRPAGPILRGLYRPCFMDYGDLDADNVEEVVVANFGIESGNVAIYGLDQGGLQFDPVPRKVLLTDTGAVASRIHDFNRDGLPDVVTLTSNARENLSIYINLGSFQFERRQVITQHSAFGYVDFEIIDINRDGYDDLITLNGDNGDNDPYNTLKPYHGLRIYLNDGDLNFSETYFYPVYGAFGMEIEDFDNDGMADIAINAFYPDFNAEQPENFVILRQTAPMEFEPRTHPATHKGRWITMNSGDLDGDGDIDIVLAAGYVTMGLVYDNMELLQEMVESWPPFLYLENKTIP